MTFLKGVTIDGEWLGCNVRIDAMFQTICQISPRIIKAFVTNLNKFGNLKEQVVIKSFVCSDNCEFQILFEHPEFEGACFVTYKKAFGEILVTGSALEFWGEDVNSVEEVMVRSENNNDSVVCEEPEVFVASDIIDEYTESEELNFNDSEDEAGVNEGVNEGVGVNDEGVDAESEEVAESVVVDDVTDDEVNNQEIEEVDEIVVESVNDVIDDIPEDYADDDTIDDKSDFEEECVSNQLIVKEKAEEVDEIEPDEEINEAEEVDEVNEAEEVSETESVEELENELDELEEEPIADEDYEVINLQASEDIKPKESDLNLSTDESIKIDTPEEEDVFCSLCDEQIEEVGESDDDESIETTEEINGQDDLNKSFEEFEDFVAEEFVSEDEIEKDESSEEMNDSEIEKAYLDFYQPFIESNESNINDDASPDMIEEDCDSCQDSFKNENLGQELPSEVIEAIKNGDIQTIINSLIRKKDPELQDYSPEFRLLGDGSAMNASVLNNELFIAGDKLYKWGELLQLEE